MGDSSRKVVLNCSNHHNLLVGGLWNLFQKKHGVDFDLKLGDRHWSVHRLIVDVFLSPEEGDANVKVKALVNEPCVNFDDGQTCSLRHDKPSEYATDLEILLLEFLYKGRVSAEQQQLANLLQLARKLNFKLLIDTIEEVERRPVICRRPRTITEKLSTRRLERGRKRSLPEQEACDADGNASPTVGLDVDTAELQPKTRKPRKSTPRKSARHHPDDAPVDVSEKTDLPESTDATTTNTTGRRSMPRRSVKEATNVACKESMSDDAGDAEEKDPSRRRLYGCPNCQYKTHIKYRLRMHLARHDAATMLFRCNFCSNAFLSAVARDRHKTRIHAGPPAALRCSHCQVEVANRNSLLSHLKVRHGVTEDGQPVEKRFGCEHCQESFVYKSALDNHVATKHTGERPFRCCECSYSAFRRPDLRKHVKFMHVKQRPFVCEVCGFATVTWSNMVKHHRVHSRDKPYVCKECGKAYAYKESLKEHAVRHAEGYSEESARSHICDVCGKGFLTRKHLMGHLKGVHHAPSLAKVVPPPQCQLDIDLPSVQVPF